MVECCDLSLYTGWCQRDLNRRVFEHNNSKKGAKYTRARRPVKLVYYEEFENKISAMKREYEIKQLTREQKFQLIASEQNKF